jgi:hypothetical protein
MPSLSFESMMEWVLSAGGGRLRYVVLGVVVLMVLWIVQEWLRRRKRPAGVPLPTNLKIDVSTLPESGPPMTPPILELYNVPMRLAAIVFAPVGRMSELPPDDELAPLLDAIVPGLDKVMELHRPLVCRWPNQVSARGFAHIFFSNVPLPTASGKGTPWSLVAGIFKSNDQPMMAGLVLCAARPNSFGQTVVDSEEKWLGCLRIRWN